MKTSLQENLSILSNLHGTSGFEKTIGNYLIKKFKKLDQFELESDGLGSLAFIKKAKNSSFAPTVSFSAHMDEVGFLVTKISDDGFIYFTPLGGISAHVSLGQRFVITTNNGEEHIAISGCKAPHILSPTERKSLIPLDKFFLDLGLDSRKKVETLGITEGNQITPFQEEVVFVKGNNRIIGKAFDNRVSVASLIELGKEINSLELDCNVILIATVQEEIGLRGALTSAYKWKAEVGFALDVTYAEDIPRYDRKAVCLGSGVSFSLIDDATVTSPILLTLMQQIAKENEIDFTFDKSVTGGTDAGAIQLAKDGVKVMSLSIPSRYMHTHNTIVDLNDILQTISLAKCFILQFNKDSFSKISK